ncbi:aspartate dehydrogenase [Nitratireductor pacificus]|uniref:L-aspartate dehydrogenase n=1 Tax=Nitratireductor pacificus pht-3B TaxID=391937 RepID=K2MMK1_9HYPH|nr:aspartate dehydrogenase [Nitratireductor pacificus]EKF18477.1 aspartate dehydrogenase [Nitratireductor pacificus pht-3B]
MRLGLIGFGNIALTLLGQLAETLDTPLEHLVVLSLPELAGDTEARLKGEFAGVAREAVVVTDAQALLSHRPGLVVECAGHAAVVAHVPAVLRNGTEVVIVSIGALSDANLETELRAAAIEGGTRLILPAGAVGGIDLLAALGAAGGLEVRYRGSKPPLAWSGTPAENTLDLGTLKEAATFFTGTAREAARDFPKNANVAATLALAGAGFEATRVELTADPAAPGNVHEYSVVSPLAKYTMRIENLPSAGNAKTSVSTVYSVLREIRNRIGPVAI